MDIMMMYEQIQQKIDQLEFSNLWKGFKKYEFAIYDDSTVILNGYAISKTDEFIANTSILYQGRYIAIWNLSGDFADTDTDILTSKIVHEMFHAYQNEKKDQRFANELEALIHYKYSLYYIQLKYNENLFLADLVSDFSNEKLKEFLTYRKNRQRDFPFEYNYENSIEAIEGSAQYVEMQALKALSEEKYKMLVNKLIHNIRSLNNLIPIRIICYDTGALFLEVCAKNNLTLDDTIGTTTKIFYSELIEKTPYKKLDIPLDAEIVNLYKDDIKALRNKINTIITNCRDVIRGNFELMGVNVYSARYLDGYIYTKHFLMYRENQPVTLYGNFLFKLENYRITEIYKEEID